MAGLTFDAGALIAAERGDRAFWTLWKEAIRRDADVTVPSAVVAQVYRGPRSAVISRVLAAGVVEPLDDRRAREVGRLLGTARASDVIDATVIASAASRGDAIVTSDPGDIGAIAEHARRAGRIIAI